MSSRLDFQRFAVGTTLALVCAFGAGNAEAANISASETGDTASVVGTQFDVTPFTSLSNGELATGSGEYIANTTATGSALVVFTEGPGGANSDFLLVTYNGSGFVEFISVLWSSDSDRGGPLVLPTGIAPSFLVETGAAQDLTAALVASATASGFAFPSNITVQGLSDAPEAVPEPATLALLGLGLVGVTASRRRKRN